MTLETETIVDVPLMRVGKGFMGQGCPKDGCEFTETDLDAIVMAYWATKDGLLPPVKLGHDDDQKLLQEDGYPSAGLVANLRRRTDKLYADLIDVPKRVAELIKAGAYRSVSVELGVDREINNQKFPQILTGLALLGADLPAIDSLGGITALYQSLQLSSEGETIILTDINDKPTDNPGPEPDISDKGGDSMSELAPVRQALGLGEDGDAVAAIEGLKGQIATLTSTLQGEAPGKVEAAQLKADLQEARQRYISLDNEKNQEMFTLKEQVTQMKAENRVEKAINAGRITHANKEYALKVSLGSQSDEEWEAFVRTLPKVDLREHGASLDLQMAEVEPTEEQMRVARQTGQTREQIMAQNARDKGFKLPA